VGRIDIDRNRCTRHETLGSTGTSGQTETRVDESVAVMEGEDGWVGPTVVALALREVNTAEQGH